MKKLTLRINDVLFERAYTMGNERGFESLDAYVASIIENAILNDWYDRALALEEPEKLLVEDDGGGMRLVDDIDDDIPF